MSQPPPDIIYIIRHGEKPADPPSPDPSDASTPVGPPFGIDFQGVQDQHSLLPRGWQRSGALTTLFAPASGTPAYGLQVPATLLSPTYGGPNKTAEHRTYQTIEGLSDRLGVAIVSDFAEGQEPELATSVVSQNSGVVLICWEHDHIPSLASSLPTIAGTVIPPQWPGDRFDVIWVFTLVPDPAAAPLYSFTQIPQQLLSGDTDTIIPVNPPPP
jgi:hypothetical protein